MVCLIAFFLVTVAMTVPTAAKPLPISILVQCGEGSCNIVKEYCHRQECFHCNPNVCNTPDYDGGNLSQCHFYCQRLLQTTTTVLPTTNATRLQEDRNTAQDNRDYPKLSGEVQVSIIVLGFVAIFLVSYVSVKWYRNRRNNRRESNDTPQKTTAALIVQPQQKYSNCTDPSERNKMVITGQ